MSDQRVSALGWGVKESFRGYVMATGGQIEALGEVQRTQDGGFVFPAAPDSTLVLDAEGRPTGQGRFTGEIRFEAHGGMLSVRLSDPILEIGDKGAILTIVDDRSGRIEIARLDLAAAAPGEANDLVAPAVLLMEGSYTLGGHYPANTPIDPVRLVTGG